MTAVNRQITLASKPVGLPAVSDFQLIYSPLPAPAAGEVLLRSLYLSLDPSMRCRMNDGPAAGEVIAGEAVGLVMQSEDPWFRVGDTVVGLLGWQEYAVVPGHALRKLDPDSAPISTALGVLGLPGITAFFGLLDLCNPQPGETVVISAAAGAVGTVVGQIAKIKGCRVVGVVGSDEKVSWLLDELGYDAAFNYKTETNLDRRLAALCPGGVDVYFDNVGGAISDAVMQHINSRARVSVCGQVSQINLESPESGPRWFERLIAKQATVRGFLVAGYADRFADGCAELTRWLTAGELKYREDVAQGIESAPQAFIGMLQGRNEGKQLVQVSNL